MEHDFISLSGAFTRRIPCVVVADCVGDSGKSNKTEIEHALREFHTVLQHDISFRDSVDICVMCAGEKIVDFCHVEQFQVPEIATDACLPLDDALDSAIDLIESTKKAYRLLGISYHRPWLYVMSAGHTANCLPNNHTKERLQSLISARKLCYVPVGIGDVNVDALQSYYPKDAYAKPVLKATVSSFRDSFHIMDDEVLPSSLDEIDIANTPTDSTLFIEEDDVDYPDTISTITVSLDDSDWVTPCVFLIERSENISSKALKKAEQMIQDFCNELEATDFIRNPEICIISYASDVIVDVDFCESIRVKIPAHMPSGDAVFNQALLIALDKLEEKRKEYFACGKYCKTPIIFAVGSGTSSDPNFKIAVVEKIQQLVDQGNLYFYAVGCGLVDVEQFCSYYGNHPLIVKAVYPTITSTLSSIPILSRSIPGPIEPTEITLAL